jgi:hypothetical protein
MSPYLALIISKRFRRHTDTPYNVRSKCDRRLFQTKMSNCFIISVRNLLLYLRSVPSHIWNNIVTINLFKRAGQQEDDNVYVYNGNQLVYIYACLLVH